MHETKREGYVRRIENVLKSDVTKITNEIIITEEATREILELLKEQPERKKGKWVNNIHDIPICNQCGYMTPYDRAIDDYEYGNYCPNCGADMRGERDE